MSEDDAWRDYDAWEARPWVTSSPARLTPGGYLPWVEYGAGPRPVPFLRPIADWALDGALAALYDPVPPDEETPR